MRVAGFTFVSNAVRLDFPIVPAIRSILPLCAEVVVNVGPSSDDTLELIRGIDDPRIRIIHGAWDNSLGRRMLSAETQRALDATRETGRSTSRPTRCCTRTACRSSRPRCARPTTIRGSRRFW